MPAGTKTQPFQRAVNDGLLLATNGTMFLELGAPIQAGENRHGVFILYAYEEGCVTEFGMTKKLQARFYGGSRNGTVTDVDELRPEVMFWQGDLAVGSAEQQKDVRAELYTLVSTDHTGGSYALVEENLRPRC